MVILVIASMIMMIMIIRPEADVPCSALPQSNEFAILMPLNYYSRVQPMRETVNIESMTVHRFVCI